MAKSTFEKQYDRAEQAGIEAYTKESKKWFFENLKYLRAVRNPRRIITDNALLKRPKIIPGRMFMYGYDPKHAKTLPYYDTFPLVIPVKTVKDGFYGINLHYLHPYDRARLFDRMRTFMLYQPAGDPFSPQNMIRTKFRVSFEKLNDSMKFRYFKPAYKRYLFSQVKTIMMLVPPKYWEVAMFLPTENFQKTSKRTVWRKSNRKFRGNK
jgi:hypothetical protein